MDVSSNGMKISVIIPTWNRARQLAGALESVYRQTYPPHEVIVVDDGSDDETRDIVSGRFPAVHYRHQENRGVSNARNTGIGLATGDWIALLDSDDEWMPCKLERQINALQRKPGFMFCHTNEIWLRNGRRVNPMKKHAKTGGRIFRHCLPRCVISPSSVLIQRNLLTQSGFDETLPACEDYDLWLRLCAAHPVLYVDDQLLIKHGGHADQLSRRYWGMDRFRVHALEKLVHRNELSEADRDAVLRTLLGKIDIVLHGATKHCNRGLTREYRDKQAYYQAMLDPPLPAIRQSGGLVR